LFYIDSYSHTSNIQAHECLAIKDGSKKVFVFICENKPSIRNRRSGYFKSSNRNKQNGKKYRDKEEQGQQNQQRQRLSSSRPACGEVFRRKRERHGLLIGDCAVKMDINRDHNKQLGVLCKNYKGGFQ